MELDKNQFIIDAVRDSGFSVAFIRHNFGASKTIYVAVENKDFTPMTIREIEKLHKSLVAKLYVENIIDENTGIEVSSPGLDRLLISASDFSRFISSKIKFSLKNEFEGRKKFQGTIKQVEGNNITIEILDGNKALLTVDVEDINQANLIPEISFSKIK